jgi:hypothetical protein
MLLHETFEGMGATANSSGQHFGEDQDWRLPGGRLAPCIDRPGTDGRALSPYLELYYQAPRTTGPNRFRPGSRSGDQMAPNYPSCTVHQINA